MRRRGQKLPEQATKQRRNVVRTHLCFGFAKLMMPLQAGHNHWAGSGRDGTGHLCSDYGPIKFGFRENANAFSLKGVW